MALLALPKARSALACLCLASPMLLYFFVAYHTPIFLFPNAPHDDGLFLALGQSLAEGRWLGSYNQFTLMKGPGYPAFLALIHWIGAPATLAHALLHVTAVAFFVVVAHQFVRSCWLSGLLFVLLLWHPASLVIIRIMRDRIYFDQLLILFAALTWTLFGSCSGRERAIFACVSGLALGWFWLTREEGIWILPALAFLLLAAFLLARHNLRVREFGLSVMLFLAVFVATQIGFSTANWWVYGKFVGVDFKEANFQRALSAITGVRYGETKPYVPLTAAARQQIYRVSDAFASLSDDFEGSLGRGWAKTSCSSQPMTCGEIGAAWFMWALRDAAANDGHFSSPTAASEFFGKLADEIEAACANGRLQCTSKTISEAPALTWTELARRLPARSVVAVNALLSGEPLLGLPSGSGSRASVANSLRFLNNPSPVVIAGEAGLSGWFHGSGAEWFSIVVKRHNGSQVNARLERRASPDIAAHFHDPLATSQRYHIGVDCDQRCIIEIHVDKRAKTEIGFAQLANAPITIELGPAILYVDSAAFSSTTPPTQASAAALELRAVVLTAYRYVLVPVAALGLVSFAASTILYWNRVLRNACYVLAATSWLLVISRLAVLLAVDITSFHVLRLDYMAPAQHILVCAAIFSCAALLQLASATRASAL